MGFVHEVWTTQDGLPVNSINALLQSRDGYIWAATFDGLVGIARAMPPDLIVVDVDGEPAGSAVDRMLGGQPGLVNVPVLVITDEAPGSDRETIGSGTDSRAILVKPFNARRLCAEVHRLLDLGHHG